MVFLGFSHSHSLCHSICICHEVFSEERTVPGLWIKIHRANSQAMGYRPRFGEAPAYNFYQPIQVSMSKMSTWMGRLRIDDFSSNYLMQLEMTYYCNLSLCLLWYILSTLAYITLDGLCMILMSTRLFDG